MVGVLALLVEVFGGLNILVLQSDSKTGGFTADPYCLLGQGLVLTFKMRQALLPSTFSPI